LCGAISAFASGIWHTNISFFEFVSMAGFLLGVILLLLHLTNLVREVAMWPLIELSLDALWSLFYVIGASLVAKWAPWSAACGSAAFFGFAALITYIIDGILIFMLLRGGRGITPTDGVGSSPAPAWTTQEPPPRY
jgi:hypothetical protein